MKRERTVLAALGAVFLVELAIGVPALRNNLRNDAPVATTSAVTPAPAVTAPDVAKATVMATPPIKATLPTLAVARTQIASATTHPQRALAFVTPLRHVSVIDDVANAGARASFTYSGHWEHVRAMEDGRTAGTSTRSYRPDAEATLQFTGTEVRIFGVCGPHGGRALLAIDGGSAVPIEFYTTVKETHMLVYRSPRLPQGTHRVSISVAPGLDATKKRYVNIDGAEVDS